MDSEVMTLLNNNQSLLEQIKQLLSGEQSTQTTTESGDANQNPMNTMGVNACMTKKNAGPEDTTKDNMNDKKKTDEVGKGLVDTSSEGSTGSDDAKNRQLEQLPENTEANADEVAKALASIVSLALRKSAVKAPVKKDPVQEMLQVMKSIAEKQNEQEKAIVGILEGFGIAEDVRKSTVQAEQVKRPVQNTDIQYLAEVLKSAIGVNSSSKEDDKLSNRNKVLKTLTSKDTLLAMVRK